MMRVLRCCSIVAAALAWGIASPAWAAGPDNVVGAQPYNLAKVWLALPNIERAGWPYAYLRLRSTDDRANRKKRDVLQELDDLSWRLDGDRYRPLKAAVEEWKQTLNRIQQYRFPGAWSPAWVMAHPRQTPPLSRVAAVGVCELPRWIEVWDSTGVARIPWMGSIRLSDVLDRDKAIGQGQADEVAVVNPEGHVDHYGIAAWNYADTALEPGTRIVATLPLGGRAFTWIRDAIADVVAHSRPGDSCREARIGIISAR